jgi:hypothetical protein
MTLDVALSFQEPHRFANRDMTNPQFGRDSIGSDALPGSRFPGDQVLADGSNGVVRVSFGRNPRGDFLARWTLRTVCQGRRDGRRRRA